MLICFSWVRIYVLPRQIEMQYNEEDTFTMITFFLRNLIGVKKLIFFKNNPVVHCIVSCAEKYFMATQLSSLNLDSFIFQLRQWALESQDTCKRWYVDHKPVSYRWDICQEPSFQSRKNQKTAKVKFTKRTDFHWFKSWLFACLNWSYELHLWYPAGTTVFLSFIWYLAIIMTSYVKGFFLNLNISY